MPELKRLLIILSVEILELSRVQSGLGSAVSSYLLRWALVNYLTLVSSGENGDKCIYGGGCIFV